MAVPIYLRTRLQHLHSGRAFVLPGEGCQLSLRDFEPKSRVKHPELCSDR